MANKDFTIIRFDFSKGIGSQTSSLKDICNALGFSY